MSVKQEIELEAANLSLDESRNGLLCPFCKGGRTGERTFSITRLSDGIVHNCWRASCSPGRGFIALGGAAVRLAPGQALLQPTDDRYTGPLFPLYTDDRKYFHQRFDLDLPAQGPVWHNDGLRYLIEIRRPDGTVRGYNVRRSGWTGVPITPRIEPYARTKSRVHLDSSQELAISWHTRTCPERFMNQCDDPRTVVLVEDQLSAMKVAQERRIGVALMGVNVDWGKVREIQQQKPTEVLIALDKDASNVAFDIARTWGLAFPKTRVILLEQDLKDLSRNEVRRILL